MTVDVLLAIPDLGAGGPDGVYARLLKGFDRQRVQPSLAVQRLTGTRISQVPTDVTVHSLETDSRYPVVQLARLVRSTRPDVVLTTLRMNHTALVARVAFPKTTKVVIREANNVSMANAELAHRSSGKAAFLRLMMPPLLRRTDAVVAQSWPMVDDLHRLLDRKGEPARVERVPNPIDGSELRILAAAGVVTAERGDPTIVTVGRLAHQKGFDLLLAAFRQVVNELPRARLWIIGEGPERRSLAHQITELGMGRSVDLLGFQPNPFPFVAAADLFVSSSRYEGLPNAVLEAQALGVPTVGTNGPGAAQDLIDIGVTGWLASPGSTTSLITVLRRALSDGPQLDRETIAVQTAERFGVAAVCREYEDLLIDITTS